MAAFRTQSSSQKTVHTILLTFLPMFALAFLGLRVAVATWLFFEIILLVTFGFCMLMGARSYFEMVFQGNRIVVYNRGNRQSYEFEDLKQSDFLIKQSSKQKTLNTCDLQIKDCMFRFNDVQNSSQLLCYIRENFPE